MTIYRGQFANQETSTTFNENEQQIITVDIEDTETDESGDPAIIELEMAESPLRISIVNNEEKKYTVLRPKQAEISINTSDSIGIETFCDGGDNRFRVHIYSQVETLFKGFLSISDLEEQFQPDPNVLILTAFDGLGFLESEQLTDSLDRIISGENTIIDYLVAILAKTGLSLPIKMVMNYKEIGSAPVIADAEFLEPRRFITALRPLFTEGREITISGTASNNVTGVIQLVTGPIVVGPHTGEYNIHLELPVTFTPEVATNVRFEDAGSHLINRIYLDAKTFEGSDIGTTLDCQECLKRLLGVLCFVVQKNGYWWVINPDEMRSTSGYYVTEFDADGIFIANAQESLTKGIGVASPMQWMNDDAIVLTERPSKIGMLTYKYEYPRELVCNIEFERGEVITPPDLAAEDSTGTYELECWVIRRLAGQPITSTVRIDRNFEYGYEKSRYAVITPADDAATPWDFIESTPIFVQEGDRLTVSVDFRFPSNYGGGEGAATYFPMRIYFIDENNDYWYWWNSNLNPAEFYWDGPSGTELEKSIPIIWNLDATDESEWSTLSVEMAALPANGRLYIGLNQMHQGEDSGDDQAVYYQNLQVQYTAKINNSYARYTGQRITITQQAEPDKYKSVLEEQVFIGEPPNRNIKGALLKKGTPQEIFTGEVSFLETPGRISISGDYRSTFREGMRITISGSVDNDTETRIVDVNFSSSGGPEITTLFLADDVVAESGIEVTISLVTFVLANRFYDGATYPNGDFPDEHVQPFGQLQAFGYWNQYNRVMRKFEGTIDRTQSQTEMPDMVHKLQLTDPHVNTNNKLFMLLHYDMDVHLCQWDGFLHEVEDSLIGKVYTGNEFKYITDE